MTGEMKSTNTSLVTPITRELWHSFCVWYDDKAHVRYISFYDPVNLSVLCVITDNIMNFSVVCVKMW